MMPRMMRPRPPAPRHGGPGPLGPGHRAPRGMAPQMSTQSYNSGPAANVGSVTNDPNTARSRVFVGNLNTIALSKEDVEGIFSRYGIVTGLSMHKGYAFVQYSNQLDARRACGAEDGMTYAGQALDINIASEPKHRPNQKTTSTAQTSSGASRLLNTQSGPPAKKMRTDSGTGGIKRTLVNLTSGNSSTAPASKTITQLAQAAKDVLICGVCKTSFSSLHSLAQHKKTPCRLKISCQCQSTPPPESPEPSQLACATCNAEFAAAWELCQHAQQEHNLSIYKVEEETVEVTVKEEVVLVDGESNEVSENGQ
ncbi:uncharacterized protein LOC133206311 [Saccostrea echinata]|uniref:uncharacterized protein LOC133175533 n=1 Tax=Saccostrea echinata TaxID=191078 RepID=UPI002A7EE464|nr:uncharacterized protein LOC133175533 [Saccostrea echinata]XP_061198252.1 uncharacterized protein LOC133206311 [Saccostrea echinata]